MSLLQVKQPKPHIVLGIWEIEEEVQELEKLVKRTSCDTAGYEKIKHQKGRKQWLATRLLLSSLLGGKEDDIVKDNNGKPFLKHSGAGISISHSLDKVALIINKKDHTGVDIQKITPKIERIRHKFTSDDETELFDETSNELLVLHLIWGAKEALYKYYGKKELIFKDHLHLFSARSENEQKGQIEAGIKCKDLRKNFLLNYEKMGDYFLVYILK